MKKEELQNSLEALESEIEQLQQADDAVKNHMRSLINEIEAHIDETDDASDEESVLGSIRNSIEEFEVEHPRITGILNRIMMTLSDMGI